MAPGGIRLENKSLRPRKTQTHGETKSGRPFSPLDLFIFLLLFCCVLRRLHSMKMIIGHTGAKRSHVLCFRYNGKEV